MITSSDNSTRKLDDRLNDPTTADSLIRLLDRADDLERLINSATQWQKTLTGFFAMGVDIVDENCRNASEQGIDINARGEQVMKLILAVTEPKTMQSLQGIVKRLPALEKATELAEGLPGLLAMFVDVFDEWSRDLKQDGIELETAIRQGLHAVLWLGQRVSRQDLDRLGVLLKSHVLDEYSVDAVGMAGTALAKCHRGTCEVDAQQQVGPIGLLRALSQPDIQRSVAFALRFAECFGRSLATKQSCPPTVEN